MMVLGAKCQAPISPRLAVASLFINHPIQFFSFFFSSFLFNLPRPKNRTRSNTRRLRHSLARLEPTACFGRKSPDPTFTIGGCAETRLHSVSWCLALYMPSQVCREGGFRLFVDSDSYAIAPTFFLSFLFPEGMGRKRGGGSNSMGLILERGGSFFFYRD